MFFERYSPGKSVADGIHKALNRCTPSTFVTSAGVGALFGSSGFVDFTIDGGDGIFWGIELLQHTSTSIRTTLNWIGTAAKRITIGPFTSHVWPHYQFIQLILPSTDSVGSGTPTEFANSSQAKRNSVNCVKTIKLSLLVVVFLVVLHRRYHSRNHLQQEELHWSGYFP
ncbi:unnamed protein product [Phytophthora lilii]|uniref:Unnamed protein product n=1 Tax=Phytophthora lilii TaxID=2077276 RepID=A0A9W6YKH3_9STRA|nr:unnamed protein product [Phytophthora lilii]